MRYWLSCARFTVQVVTDDRGVITWAAPVVRRFVGQPLVNLLRWVGPCHQLEEL